ncbi:L-type lectin-domain containing receptor kinase IX.1-like protein [Tanacetum coccineum]
MNSNGLQHYGDGLTFFLAQNNIVLAPGGAMGFPTIYSNVISPYRFAAVEFDTFWNVWDPLDSSNTSIGDHVGISISSLKSVTYQKWLSNVSGGGECQAWITYDSVSKILSVNFTGYQNNRVIRQDGLAYMVDLRKELPEWVIFGFSAGTGALFQKNDVRSWSFDGSDLEVDKRNEQPPNPLIPNLDPVIRNNINVGLIYWAETQSTGLTKEQLLQITKHKTAKAIWDALKTKHIGEERVQQARLQTLKSDFEMLHMKEDEAIDTFTAKLTTLIVASIEQYSDLDEMSVDEAIQKIEDI